MSSVQLHRLHPLSHFAQVSECPEQRRANQASCEQRASGDYRCQRQGRDQQQVEEEVAVEGRKIQAATKG